MSKEMIPIARITGDIAAILKAIRQLMAPPEKPRREIGFHVCEKQRRYRVGKTA